MASAYIKVSFFVGIKNKFDLDLYLCINHDLITYNILFQIYWREKLRYKFGNERKCRDRNVPEVLAKKRKRPAEESNKQTDMTTLTWGMANYMPAIPVSEDETSLKVCHYV